MALHIRIKQKGLERYTGMIGMVEFKEGRSVDLMSIQEAIRIGASMPITDDDGNEISPVTYYSRESHAKREAQAKEKTDAESGEDGNPDNSDNPGGGDSDNTPEGEDSEDLSSADADVGDEDKTETNNPTGSEDGEQEGANPEDGAEGAEDSSSVEGIEGTEDGGDKYTREYLESVADDRGIKGLREIGEKHDVSAKSIEELIEKLLKV